MNKLDDFLNSMSDSDSTWWQLLAVRPAKEEKMTDMTVLSLTPVFGTLSALAPILAYEVLMRKSPPPGCVLATIAIGVGLFFLGYKMTFARSWNRRAQLLNSTAEHDEAAGKGTQPDRGDFPNNTPIPFRPAPRPPKNSVA